MVEILIVVVLVVILLVLLLTEAALGIRWLVKRHKDAPPLNCQVK